MFTLSAVVPCFRRIRDVKHDASPAECFPLSFPSLVSSSTVVCVSRASVMKLMIEHKLLTELQQLVDLFSFIHSFIKMFYSVKTQSTRRIFY